MPSRRQVLSLLAAAPLLAHCSTGSDVDPAEAWRAPGAGEQDPRRFALAHAILAPSPHNTQGWRVDLDDADGMTLFADLDRRLDFTDPYNRQVTIGLGGFLELYRMSAAHLGYAPVITPFPDGAPSGRLDARPIARVQLGSRGAANAEPLFDAITLRRTNRNPYDARVPDAAALAALVAIADGIQAIVTNDTAKVTQLRDLVWRGYDRESRTAEASAETYQWLRFGRGEIARHRDGLSIDGPMIPALKALGQLDAAHIADPDSLANTTTSPDWKRKADTAPAFIWLNTDGDSAEARLAAGRAYIRLNLAATQAGLALHPWSQTLQEYAAMADLYQEMRNALSAAEGETVQMLARVGYAEDVAPSPRRALDDVVTA